MTVQWMVVISIGLICITTMVNNSVIELLRDIMREKHSHSISIRRLCQDMRASEGHIKELDIALTRVLISNPDLLESIGDCQFAASIKRYNKELSNSVDSK